MADELLERDKESLRELSASNYSEQAYVIDP